MISVQTLQQVCQEMYAVAAEQEFGNEGVDAVFQIIDTLRELYRFVEPVRVKGALVVFRTVDAENAAFLEGKGEICGGFHMLSRKAEAGLVVEIRPDGRTYIHGNAVANSEQLAQIGVVYEYQNGKEHFLVKAHRKEVIPFVDQTAVSQFCAPIFFSVREALLHYAESNIRKSSCPIFREAWDDENRLFMKAGPEEVIRDSLVEFLRARLGGGYEVRPEQNMDASHPVDIKITKMLTNRLMILEIKWLGDSRNSDGRVTVKHRTYRANEGAQQLADYLEQNLEKAPLNITQGYYVVIDARREGLTPTSKTISKENGFHYADREIEFDPEYDEVRRDFDPPYRMFAEPVVSNE